MAYADLGVPSSEAVCSAFGRAAGPVSPPAPPAEVLGTQARTLVIPSTTSSTWEIVSSV